MPTRPSRDVTPSPVELTVNVDSERFHPDDDRWLAQARDLFAELRAEVPGFRVASSTVTGTKGSIESVILALGSAGAFSAAVTIFKAWLARDKSRRIAITWTEDGHEERIVVEGDAVDEESFQRLNEAIGARLGAEG